MSGPMTWSRIAPTKGGSIGCSISSTSSRNECLAIRVERKLKSTDVIEVLSDQFILRGVPGHIRSDNRPEFVAKAVQDWVRAVGAKTASIARGSPWENGFIESFNARLRDGSLGYKPPAPGVFIPAFAARPALQPDQRRRPR
jgi:putative transposase